ncbi:MAG: hypothetical protein JNK76_12910 [Planctomycetales bacterium]|nr:hypothetical protein [Planctomycetales bacterium]MBN8627689.1 hypothetical protein [Planctomycetota bacterium]
MNAQTRLVDLPPRGILPYVGLFLGGAMIVALLLAAYGAMPRLNPHTTDGQVASFDLDGEGSLAVFFSSFTLLAAGGVCLFNFTLLGGTRTPRRIWLWAACCWSVMAIDECASLHEAFKEMMSHATGWRLGPEGCFWWIAAYGVVLSATGWKLLRAMRAGVPACVMFVSVAGFYGTAVLAELGWLMAKDMRGVMVEEGCEMLGNFALLTSMALFARHTARELTKPPEAVLLARFADEPQVLALAPLGSRRDEPVGV